MKKMVGVAIPVLNEEKYITRTLSSFSRQTDGYHGFFIVLADNGSTDKTLELVNQFTKKHPQLSITVTNEKKRGKRFARKRAMDTAAGLGARYILSTDADTVVPADIIATTSSLLGNSSKLVLRGRIFFPADTLLLKIIYYTKLLELADRLRSLENKIFGPVFSGAYFAVPSSLYAEVSYRDIDTPLITQEDHLLSRRLYYAGARFIKSPNCVTTSDRRFWGDRALWLQGIRVPDYRQVRRRVVRPISQEELAQLSESRIKIAVDRYLRQYVDAAYIWRLTGFKQKRASLSMSTFCRLFHIQDKIGKSVTFSQRMPIYEDVKNLYEGRMFEQIKHSYLGL